MRCHNKNVCFVHWRDSLVFKCTLKTILNQVSILLRWKCSKTLQAHSHLFWSICDFRHTWQVQNKPMANNVAYTSGELSLHTDYPARTIHLEWVYTHTTHTQPHTPHTTPHTNTTHTHTQHNHTPHTHTHTYTHTTHNTNTQNNQHLSTHNTHTTHHTHQVLFYH